MLVLMVADKTAFTRITGEWVDEYTIAKLLKLNPSTLRTWRWLEAKDGVRRGGLTWRRFGRAIRYWVTPDLVGQAPPDGREAA